MGETFFSFFWCFVDSPCPHFTQTFRKLPGSPFIQEKIASLWRTTSESCHRYPGLAGFHTSCFSFSFFSDFGFDLIPLLVLLIFRVDQKDSTFGNHLILRVRFSDHPSHSTQRCMLRQ